MDILITRREKSVHVPLERLPDGSWSAREGDDLRIRVRASTPAAVTLAGAMLTLEHVTQEGNVLETCFRLSIETWAGRARLLVQAGQTEQTEALDVSPHPGKLGVDAYREMLAELVAISKDLPWGLGPGSHAATRADESPMLVHASVIDAELPALLQALRRLALDPLSWTRRERVLERLPANRRVDPASFRWLVAHPRALGAVRPSSPTQSADSGVFIEQRRIQSTLDHPATRYLSYLLERLLRTLRRSSKAFHQISGREPRAIEYAHVLDAATEEIEATLGRVPFKGVLPEPLGPGSLQAVIDHPSYARVQRLAQRLLDPGMQLDEQGAFSSSLGYTYELFELLALYRLAGGLSRELGEAWTCTSTPPRSSGLLERPPFGCVWRAASVNGLVLELHYQRTFTAWSEQGLHFQSLSGERRPDYVLLILREDKPLGWIVLDAKYRSSRDAIHQGLADLHVYRDSLRWHGQPARAGFILVPQTTEGASAYATASYHQTHHFGALILQASEWWTPILNEIQEASGLAHYRFPTSRTPSTTA
ncbi:DUF2357 domain-containing protein [Hyalangium minutum]|uniref:DUF2357 domain-containing protein n=1 Tax=Hyalangium minutum TaxID=394096 RepID=A0A085W787_9BACT|nr:DUF2357 domain-containing protein [Hyalangium minutum]KFE63550.1 hypothetical protein DB31_2668 [Hyalangium minutum]